MSQEASSPSGADSKSISDFKIAYFGLDDKHNIRDVTTYSEYEAYRIPYNSEKRPIALSRERNLRKKTPAPIQDYMQFSDARTNYGDHPVIRHFLVSIFLNLVGSFAQRYHWNLFREMR